LAALRYIFLDKVKGSSGYQETMRILKSSDNARVIVYRSFYVAVQ